MSISIRPATIGDLIKVQECNLLCLPENYQLKYYIYHIISWPQLSFVAVTEDRDIVGYVLAKLDEDDTAHVTGHLTSVAVKRPYRRLGLAEKLLVQSLHSMTHIFRAEHASLHVRRSNKGAISLYKDKLSFEIYQEEPKYYADGEDAFMMRKTLESNKQQT